MKFDTSRTSTGCIACSGGPGTSQRPPRCARVSSFSPRPTYSPGPRITPGRRINDPLGDASAASSHPAFNVPYCNGTGRAATSASDSKASSLDGHNGDDSSTGAAGQSRYALTVETRTYL